MFDALARFADGRAARVCVAAAVFFVLAAVLGGSVASRMAPYGADDPSTESVRANEILERAGFRPADVVVVVRDVPAGRPASPARVERVRQRVLEHEDVAAARGFYQTGARSFLSRDRRDTYLAVSLEPTDDKARQEAAADIAEEFEGSSTVLVGGPALSNEEVNKQVEEDLRTAEMIVFPLLFLLSLLFFRSLVAALLPLMIGALAIVGTFLVLRIATEFGSISFFALNLTTGLGLGLAIDYSLFIVSRYREEIARTGPGLAAMRRTLGTAGRSVLFSSLTVAVSLAALLIFPQRFLYSMGLGGVIVALLAAFVSLTVLPAVLTLLGERVNSLAPSFLQRRADRDARPDENGFWYRLSQFVMRRPVPIAGLSALLLIVVGLPFFGIKFTSVDATILPEDAMSRQAFELMDSRFQPNQDTPLRVVVQGGEPGAVERVSAELEAQPGVARVNPPLRLGPELTVVEAVPTGDYLAGSSRDAVDAVRAMPDPPGSKVLVTGFTAGFEDFQQSLVDHLPYALLIIVGATLVILFLMTGSVILPVKSLIMNALNLSAVFGLLVVVFQDGRLQGLLGYSSQGGIDQSMPILILAIVFGLSTDYAVFLLSRIKEARDSGHSDSEAVAVGLERTGRIVTAAALLFAIAVGAFATSEIIFIKEMGVGTALAVLIDATIIRALLVPSLMELLGSWNWWAPGPLRRLHQRFGISEAGPVDPPGPLTERT